MVALQGAAFRKVYWSLNHDGWVNLDDIEMPRRCPALILLPTKPKRSWLPLVSPRTKKRLELAACVLVGAAASIAWQLMSA